METPGARMDSMSFAERLLELGPRLYVDLLSDAAMKLRDRAILSAFALLAVSLNIFKLQEVELGPIHLTGDASQRIVIGTVIALTLFLFVDFVTQYGFEKERWGWNVGLSELKTLNVDIIKASQERWAANHEQFQAAMIELSELLDKPAKLTAKRKLLMDLGPEVTAETFSNIERLHAMTHDDIAKGRWPQSRSDELFEEFQALQEEVDQETAAWENKTRPRRRELEAIIAALQSDSELNALQSQMVDFTALSNQLARLIKRRRLIQITFTSALCISAGAVGLVRVLAG
jgi:hypothetical protein